MFGKLSKEEKVQKKKDEDWMTKKWRPMMAMMYMICCLCDFAIFPIMFTIVQFWEVQAANDAFRQWVPITLQGGGLFHVAMGAVLGVSAFGRTQEKIAGASSAATSLPAGLPTQQLSSAPPAFTPPPVQNSWGNQPVQSGSFSAPASWGTTDISTTASGKKIVPGFEQPLI